jgi:hypothetical protein
VLIQQCVSKKTKSLTPRREVKQMGFIADLIEENRPKIVNKSEALENNYKFSFVSLDKVVTQHGEQWAVQSVNEDTGEEATIFFSTGRNWFNNILEGVKQHIEKTGKAADGIALNGKIKKAATYNKAGIMMEPAEYTSFTIREWAESYDEA